MSTPGNPIGSDPFNTAPFGSGSATPPPPPPPNSNQWGGGLWSVNLWGPDYVPAPGEPPIPVNNGATGSTTWLFVYQQVCNVLLEPGGLQSGEIDLEDFFNIGTDVLNQFMWRTGLLKKIANDVIQYGVGTYPEPAEITDVQMAVAAGTSLNRESGYTLDKYDSEWPYDINYPTNFREDELPPKMLQIYPKPIFQGDASSFIGESVPATGTTPSTGKQHLFGGALWSSQLWGAGFVQGSIFPSYPVAVISAVLQANDFNIQPYFYGYGTPAVWDGAPYVETLNQGYGILRYIECSQNNLEMFGAALPVNQNPILTDNIELIPDAFIPYLKYGILARIYSSDNELKDDQKAAYCNARYQEGLNLGIALMTMEPDEM